MKVYWKSWPGNSVVARSFTIGLHKISHLNKNVNLKSNTPPCLNLKKSMKIGEVGSRKRKDSMEIFVEVELQLPMDQDASRLKRKATNMGSGNIKRIPLEDQTNMLPVSKKQRKLNTFEGSSSSSIKLHIQSTSTLKPIVEQTIDMDAAGDVHSLDMLPSEILLTIFKMLPTLSRGRISLVSKRWCSISRENKIMESFDIDCYGMMIKNSMKHSKTVKDYISLRTHMEINIDMRCVLIDWMIEVSAEFKMQTETTFLAANIIDRYLSKVESNIPRSRFQLLGVTALLIASKLEELSAPTISDLVYICDNTYTREEILEMESNMLNLLGFDLTIFTTRHYVQHLLNTISEYECIDPPSKLTISHLANYLIELGLLEYRLNLYRPSLVAASAICLARLTTGVTSWTSFLQQETFISLKDMEPICNVLSTLFSTACTKPCQATYTKFSHPKYQQVATRILHSLNLN